MIAGVDIGGTKIAVGMVDESGRLLSHAESPTSPERGFAAAMARTVKILRDVACNAQLEISGIGIGSTGPIDPISGAIGDVPFFPTWRGGNPVRELEREFPVRVAMENDADAAALGEAGWGAGKTKSRLIYVTVGTGIGVGIVIDGHLYRGVAHAHPEIGHHLIDPSGPPCSCGFRGCWESLAAGPAMVQWMQTEAPRDYPHRQSLSAKQICELARGGDEWARKCVDREARYLGFGLANLITIFAPDAIVLSGSIMKSRDLFLPAIQEIIRESCRLVPAEKTELVTASLGEHANLIGAARVWYHRFAQGTHSHG
jgi:glucokinase